MNSIIPNLAILCALGLLSTTPALGQATDVDCGACVDTRDISSKAVTSGKIAAKAITSGKIKPGAVTTGKIADGAVTADKLAGDADFSNEVSILQGEQSVQNDRLDSLEARSDVLDENERSSIWSNLTNAHFDLVRIGYDLYSCGQYSLFGCDRAISANGTEFSDLRYLPRTVSAIFTDPVTMTVIAAVPADIYAGHTELRFVGGANLSAHRNRGQMLVNDCDNPTVGYVQQSRTPRSNLTPATVMNNSGQIYELDNFDSVDVDVTDNTYGVMNFIVHSDITTPICTPGVSDRTGIWQQYTYTFALDLSDVRFDGPFSYLGSSIGLLDRVEALENPPPLPPAAP